MFLTRIRRIGLLSLIALCFGGLLLFLTGLNGLIGSDSIEGKVPSWDKVRLFTYGSRLSIQSWLAILGVGFGLLSYGFHGTYIHLFDWWCSYRAQSDDGLDYGLYLNSQLQAPVLYDHRGLTGLITVRYLFALSSVGASIGYKFGIVKADLTYDGHIDLDQLYVSRPTFERSIDDGNPWLTDRPDHRAGVNRAFYHEEEDSWDPPHSTIMAGAMGCDASDLPVTGIGTIYTREYVIVANMTELDVEGEGTVVEHGLYVNDHWLRTYLFMDTIGGGWFNPSRSESGAVVEYRYDRIDEIHVRWAEYELSNYWIDKGKWPVVRHVKYKLYYAVAEVRRRIKDGSCSMLESYETPIQLLSVDRKSPKHGGFLPMNKNFHEWIWARSILTTWGINSRDGVSGILQVGMALFGSWMELLNNDADTFYPFGQFVPIGVHPYGSEITPDRLWGPQGILDYPFLHADGWTATGVVITGAYIFLTLGCLALFVALMRIYLGPPALTSWMGQHIFLAQSGAISMPQEDLASGYKAAQTGLAKLKL
ncbi:hypothetical protein NM208_g4194 [Fusarium decemcellulare]|uniref:Uncharacterized protein n=1 Tax=Fusarium decemcellulare TaxID=57161 RepID=A0ACC1SLX7_9HYPO|nr:hypothetical protein NM208_g4194 [Fusarium decemcellulare]